MRCVTCLLYECSREVPGKELQRLTVDGPRECGVGMWRVWNYYARSRVLWVAGDVLDL